MGCGITIRNNFLAGPEEIDRRIDASTEIAQIILGRRTELARQPLIIGIVCGTNDKACGTAAVADVGDHARLNLSEAFHVAAHVVEQDAKNIHANLVDLRHFGALRCLRTGVVVTIDFKWRESDPEGNAALSAPRAELRQGLQRLLRNRLAPLAAKEGLGLGRVDIELVSPAGREN